MNIEYQYADNPHCSKKKEKEANLVSTNTFSSSSDSNAFCTILHIADKSEMSLFTFEFRGCAALDTCCLASCGVVGWFKSYKKSLSKDTRS